MGIIIFLSASSVVVTTSQSISWTDIAREAVDHLAHILAHGTSSPPAWELPAAKYLLNLFESEGIPAILLPPEAGSASGTETLTRPNLVAHIPGSDAGEPILLLSHLDSAPRTLRDLDLPGRAAGRTVQGPGALMGTHLAVAHAMALIILARSGTPLKRTVRYAATCEGTGGKGKGLRDLVNNHLEHITSDLALGWGAFSWMGPDGIPCSLLAYGEKGSLRMTLRSEGGGGRPGVVIGSNPSERLVKALDSLSEIEFPVNVSDESVQFVESLAATMPEQHLQDLLMGLNKEDTADETLKAIDLEPLIDPGLKALLRAYVKTEGSIVRIDASAAEGLMPSIAEAEIHYYFPQGEDAETIAIQVMEALKSDGVYLSEKHVSNPARNDLTDEVLALARAALAEVDPRARLMTGITPWPTGLNALRKFGTSIYGWEPFANAGNLPKTLGARGGPGEYIESGDFIREIRAFYSFLVRATC